MTLISITAPLTGPTASRQGDLIIPGTEVGFGGFSSLIGRKSTSNSTDRDSGDLDVYLLGMTGSGLQLARVGINDINAYAKYTFWSPPTGTFVSSPPNLALTNPTQFYLPGTYSSGSIFYSPYFETFLMVYFNKLADSTFYIRFLDLSQPLSTNNDNIWVANGKNSTGIDPEDVEALVKYLWSDQQILYESKPSKSSFKSPHPLPHHLKSPTFSQRFSQPHLTPPTDKGGFNYAGTPHPEYFNRYYYPPSQYPPLHSRLRAPKPLVWRRPRPPPSLLPHPLPNLQPPTTYPTGNTSSSHTRAN